LGLSTPNLLELGHAIASGTIRVVDLQEVQDGAHTPGSDPDVIKWLVEERDLYGFWYRDNRHPCRPGATFPSRCAAHCYIQGHGRHALQCLTNLDLLRPTGAIIIAAPLKITPAALGVLALTSTAAS
jgi:kynurenine formamidase